MTGRSVLTRESLALCAVPLILLAVNRLTLQMAGGFVPDPNYAYLFNGLEILDLHPPSYFDHPGTPLEVLAAIVILLTWLVRLPFEFTGLLTSVFTQAEFYLVVINAVLVALTAAAVFWFGWRVRDTTGSLTAALAGQASILLCFPALIALNHVTPEPLLLAATFALASFLTPIVLGGATVSGRAAKIIGLMLGFAIAIKFTALPLLAAILFLTDRTSQKKAALYAGAGFILFTLLTAHHYPQMLLWVFKLSTHQGGYGTGPVGVPGIGVLLERGAALLRQTPELFAAVILYFAAFLLGPAAARRLFGVSALILTIQILMCLKASEARYLTPVVAIIALAAAGLVHCALSLPPARTRLAGGMILSALFAVGLWHNLLSISIWAHDAQAVDADNQKIISQAAATGCALVPYYSVRFPLYNLTFGNEFTNNHFRQSLQREFPHAATYDILHKTFSFFGAPISPHRVRQHLGNPCFYMVGSPAERFGSAFGIPREALTMVRSSGLKTDPVVVYEFHAGAPP